MFKTSQHEWCHQTLKKGRWAQLQGLKSLWKGSKLAQTGRIGKGLHYFIFLMCNCWSCVWCARSRGDKTHQWSGEIRNQQHRFNTCTQSGEGVNASVQNNLTNLGKIVGCISFSLSFYRGFVTFLNPEVIVLVLFPISLGGVQDWKTKRANVKKIFSHLPLTFWPFQRRKAKSRVETAKRGAVQGRGTKVNRRELNLKSQL